MAPNRRRGDRSRGRCSAAGDIATGTPPRTHAGAIRADAVAAAETGLAEAVDLLPLPTHERDLPPPPPRPGPAAVADIARLGAAVRATPRRRRGQRWAAGTQDR